jgi:hypothetical protein
VAAADRQHHAAAVTTGGWHGPVPSSAVVQDTPTPLCTGSWPASPGGLMGCELLVGCWLMALAG